jgi:hypothetical protein
MEIIKPVIEMMIPGITILSQAIADRVAIFVNRARFVFMLKRY